MDKSPFLDHTCINWQIANSAWDELRDKVSSEELLYSLRHSPRLIARHIRALEREYRQDHPGATVDEVLDYIVSVLRETDR